MSRILVCRLDNLGDVVLAGPAVRAAASHGEVTMLCGPDGARAAALLPGVQDVMVWEAPWVGFSPPDVDGQGTQRLVERVRNRRFDAAAILTSYHQSPLPLALLLRLARIDQMGAVGVDYPGSLLDHRVGYVEGMHEVEQALSVVGALGFHLPPGDDGRLHINPGSPPAFLPASYVVVHPGASVPARAIPPRLSLDVIKGLLAEGREVVVTGSPEEQGQPTFGGFPEGMHDLRGFTDVATLAGVIDKADLVVVGNSGPAHIAAATGTPVVSVFAPVVAMQRWRPWKVPAVVLGDQEIGCAGCRSRRCPLERQLCVDHLTAAMVLEAVDRLLDRSAVAVP